jgi:hypothetical protein
MAPQLLGQPFDRGFHLRDLRPQLGQPRGLHKIIAGATGGAQSHT